MRPAARQASAQKPRSRAGWVTTRAAALLLAQLAALGVRTEVGIDADAPTGTVLVVDGEIRADSGANARYAPRAPSATRGRTPSPATSRRRRRRRHRGERRRGAPPRRRPMPARYPAGAPVVPRERRSGTADHRRRRRGGSSAAGPRAAARLRHARRRGRGRRVGGAVHRATSPATGTNDDVSGAGDAFAAALLVALARGTAVPDALALACEAGAGVARAGGAAAALGAR